MKAYNIRWVHLFCIKMLRGIICSLKGCIPWCNSRLGEILPNLCADKNMNLSRVNVVLSVRNCFHGVLLRIDGAKQVYYSKASELLVIHVNQALSSL